MNANGAISKLWKDLKIEFELQEEHQRTEGPERHSNVHFVIVVQVAAKFKKRTIFQQMPSLTLLWMQ